METGHFSISGLVYIAMVIICGTAVTVVATFNVMVEQLIAVAIQFSAETKTRFYFIIQIRLYEIISLAVTYYFQNPVHLRLKRRLNNGWSSNKLAH